MQRRSLILTAPRGLEWVAEELPPLKPNEVLVQTKELMIVGSSDGLNYQEHAKWYFTVVGEHDHTLEQLFGYRTTANDLISTFERLASGTIASVKVLAEYSLDMGSE